MKEHVLCNWGTIVFAPNDCELISCTELGTFCQDGIQNDSSLYHSSDMCSSLQLSARKFVFRMLCNSASRVSVKLLRQFHEERKKVAATKSSALRSEKLFQSLHPRRGCLAIVDLLRENPRVASLIVLS